MNHRADERIERWLAAEAAGDEERAEDAFAAAVSALPRLAPDPGFATRVVCAVVPAPARRWGWVPSAAAAIAIAIAGMTVGLLPSIRVLPIGLPTSNEIVRATLRVARWVGEWVSAGFGAWDLLAAIAGALGAAASTPQAASALAATVTFVSLALYTLHRLLVPERRPRS